MADPRQQAALTSALALRTPEDVIQLFAALQLPVCDDAAAIQTKIDALSARYQRDKNSPDRDLAHRANNWFKNAAELKQHRHELIEIVYGKFHHQADAALQGAIAAGLTKPTKRLVEALRAILRDHCRTDDDLTERFLTRYLRECGLELDGAQVEPAVASPSAQHISSGPVSVQRTKALSSRMSLFLSASLLGAVSGIIYFFLGTLRTGPWPQIIDSAVSLTCMMIVLSRLRFDSPLSLQQKIAISGGYAMCDWLTLLFVLALVKVGLYSTTTTLGAAEFGAVSGTCLALLLCGARNSLRWKHGVSIMLFRTGASLLATACSSLLSDRGTFYGASIFRDSDFVGSFIVTSAGAGSIFWALRKDSPGTRRPWAILVAFILMLSVAVGILLSKGTPTPRLLSFSDATARLRFFESGAVFPPPEGRQYAKRFESVRTRYVYGELELAYTTREKNVSFTVFASLYGPDGALLTQQPVSVSLYEGQSTSLHVTNGWGNQKPGSLRRGRHRLVVGVKNEILASDSFEVF